MTSAQAAGVEPQRSGQLPPVYVWLAAAAELAVAALVGVILLRSGAPAPPVAHSMPGMSGMPAHHQAPQIHWTASSITTIVVTSALLVWWFLSRNRLPAMLSGIALLGVTALEPVRAMALQSHLVAMAALEAVLVAAPLLIIAALGRNRARSGSPRSRAWAVCVVIAVAVNSSLLIALHLPNVHGKATSLDAVPLWLPGLAVLIGLGYWAAVLLTAGRVAPALRRGALIVGQEVAMILGLAALFLPSPYMNHANPLGLSSTMDQRLGGVLMVLTCAAVAFPLVRKLDERAATHPFETENHVH